MQQQPLSLNPQTHFLNRWWNRNTKRSRGEDLHVAEAVFSHLVVCFSFFFSFLLSWHCLLCDFIVNQMSKLIKFAAVQHRAVPKDIYMELQPESELAIINCIFMFLFTFFFLFFFFSPLYKLLFGSSQMLMNNMLLLKARHSKTSRVCFALSSF